MFRLNFPIHFLFDFYSTVTGKLKCYRNLLSLQFYFEVGAKKKSKKLIFKKGKMADEYDDSDFVFEFKNKGPRSAARVTFFWRLFSTNRNLIVEKKKETNKRERLAEEKEEGKKEISTKKRKTRSTKDEEKGEGEKEEKVEEGNKENEKKGKKGRGRAKKVEEKEEEEKVEENGRRIRRQ